MKRKTIQRWMGACLLGSAAATGCSQTESQVAERPPWVAQPVTHPKIAQPVLAQRPVEQPRTPVLPSAPPPAALAAAAPASLPPVAPNAVQLAAPTMLPPVASAERNPAPDPAITQATYDDSKANPVGEAGPVRKSFVDLTAHPCFNHATDYSALTGQLQHSHISKGWRLRYASVDEADPYGGSVTLSDDARLSGMKDGDFVRAQGRLVNPEERTIAPLFQIDSIQPLEKQ